MKVQITQIEYDFEMEDDTYPAEIEQMIITNGTIGKAYEMSEDFEYEEDFLMCLADVITDETGWCVKTLEYAVV